MRYKHIIFGTILLVFLFAFLVKATDITDCTNLTSTYTTYTLTQNISNSSSTFCMDFQDSNIILDCAGYTIQGTNTSDTTGAYSSHSNNTIQNCIFVNWMYGAFFASGASDNAIYNSSLNANTRHGIVLADPSNILGTNLSISDNTLNGLYIDSPNSIINYSEIINNLDGGIFLGSVSSNETFYNNLFNNTNNTNFDTTSTNYWNTTNQTGTRIYSSGTNIGGNYYTNSSGNGYSDTCTDADADGFCDTLFTLATNNVDYLPYSNNWGTDITPPTYSNVGVNDTAPLPLAYILFYSQWNDETALDKFILSWNASGTSCDTWANDSSASFQTENWTNTTQQMPLACTGQTIGYIFYANDTSNNWNNTGIQIITEQGVPVLSATPSTQTIVVQHGHSNTTIITLTVSNGTANVTLSWVNATDTSATANATSWTDFQGISDVLINMSVSSAETQDQTLLFEFNTTTAGANNASANITTNITNYNFSISTCTSPNMPGATYSLIADITNSTNPTCMNITADNITLDCQGYTIDSDGVNGNYGISAIGFNNLTIRNCILTDWISSGIYIGTSSSNSLYNNTINSDDVGIGIHLVYSTLNAIYNNTLISNTGVDLEFSDNNLIHENIITSENTLNFVEGSGNLIYNNLLNNSDVVIFQGNIYENFWNTTKQTGTRIYSSGTNIGGNYYTNSSGNGYSDTCYEYDGDKLCDYAFDILNNMVCTTNCSNNTDYLPLAMKTNLPPKILILSPINNAVITYLAQPFNVTVTITGLYSTYNATLYANSSYISSAIVPNNIMTNLTWMAHAVGSYNLTVVAENWEP